MTNFIHIQEGHRNEFLEKAAALFDRYHHWIDLAYTENDNDLTVQFTLKMTPNRLDGIDLVTGISFTAEKIKDSLKSTIYERQRTLDFKPPADKPTRRRPLSCGYTPGEKTRLRGYQHR